MNISSSSSAMSSLLQMAQSLQGHVADSLLPEQQMVSSSKESFQAELTQGQRAVSNAQTPTTAGAPQSSTMVNGATAPLAGTAANFNTLGNVSTAMALKDFALLSPQNVLLQQNMLLTTNAAFTSPALFMQLGMLQKLYTSLQDILKQRKGSGLAPSASPMTGLTEEAALQAKAITFTFLERCFSLFEEKHIAWTRLFKKGPEGESLHDEDTDDEFGTTWVDADAETDYIKRPRHEKPGMLFHEALLT